MISIRGGEEFEDGLYNILLTFNFYKNIHSATQLLNLLLKIIVDYF